MVARKIGEFFSRSGFASMKGRYSEVTYWYNIKDDRVIYFCVCDFSKGVFILREELVEDMHNINRQFELRGCRGIYSMAILCAYDAMEARNVVRYDMAHWIVDLNTMQLITYEDQPGDFFGVRQPLEKELGSISSMTVRSVKSSLAGDFSLFNTIIVIINVIAFIVLEIMGDTQDAYFMYEHGAIYARAVTESEEYYRLFTSMFMHFGVEHLAGNMMVLIFIGDNLERALGKIKYVLLYIVSGVCAGACSVAFNLLTESNAVCAGASGAIFGVIGALLYIVWKNKGKLEDLSGFRFSIMVLYMLLSGFTSDGVDNVAHIGGLVAGFLVGILFYRKKQQAKEDFA